MTFQRRDLAGYLAVLRFRGSETVLVEGKDDRRTVSRALQEFLRANRAGPRPIVVDYSEMIDLPGRGLGAREVVEEVHAAAQASGLRLHALVDREFREFVVTDAAFVDSLKSHCRPAPGMTWTRGHSMENLFFEISYIQDFLRYRYSDVLRSEAIDGLAVFWPALIQNAVALSIAGKNAGLLARLRGALTIHSWLTPSSNSIELSAAELESICLTRGVSPLDSTAFRTAFESLLSLARSHVEPDCLRWLTHGHIGDEVIWSGVGRLVVHLGATANLAREVASGFQEEKALHRSDRWAQLHTSGATVTTPVPLWEALGVRLDGTRCVD